MIMARKLATIAVTTKSGNVKNKHNIDNVKSDVDSTEIVDDMCAVDEPMQPATMIMAVG